MKAKSYLERIKVLDSKIDARIEEIATLDAIAKKTTSVMGGDRVQASTSQEKMADCVAKIVDLKEELNKEIDSFIDYRNEVRKLIDAACDADCHKLLHKRYVGTFNEEKDRVEFKTWEQIAVEMNFTYQWVSGGLHQRALSQVQKALDAREKG
jgi:hypothetical protein